MSRFRILPYLLPPASNSAVQKDILIYYLPWKSIGSGFIRCAANSCLPRLSHGLSRPGTPKLYLCSQKLSWIGSDKTFLNVRSACTKRIFHLLSLAPSFDLWFAFNRSLIRDHLRFRVISNRRHFKNKSRERGRGRYIGYEESLHDVQGRHEHNTF